MRLFIAVDLDKENKKNLSSLIYELGEIEGKIKWVTLENIHLTLKFIGNTQENAIEKIRAIISDTVKKYSLFKMGLSGLGCFPNIKHPSVFWVGIKEGKGHLASLAKDLDEALSKIGLEKEKKDFSAHVTLARIDFLKNINLFQEKISKIDFSSKKLIDVAEVLLFESILTPRGPIYKKLFSFPLNR